MDIRSSRKRGRAGRRGFVRKAMIAVVLVAIAGGVSFAVWKVGSRLEAVADGTAEPLVPVVDPRTLSAEKAWQARVDEAVAARKPVPLDRLSLAPVSTAHEDATRSVWHPDVDTGLEADKLSSSARWFTTFGKEDDREGRSFSAGDAGFSSPAEAIALIRSITRAPEERTVAQPFQIGTRRHRVAAWQAVSSLSEFQGELAASASSFPPPDGKCVIVDLEVAGGAALPGMFQRDSHIVGADGVAVPMDEKLTDAVNVAGTPGRCRLGFVVPAAAVEGPYLSLVLNNGLGWARVELLRKRALAPDDGRKVAIAEKKGTAAAATTATE